ncbi:MAG TPA: VWA domain-containing protein [Actinophytocola sp.]|uniref:vWA domain-containing protein n=1 Tax=Actinophytocola sp. TaxID=1872138 RepID=UPI002DBF3292|nr:VWA domain-containing protein [Actinophytocola sp.]HEU5473487.1 VWA domain-containing protein [Actinophytocola sp.]
MPDLADLVAAFGDRLRAAGLPAGPDRCERFARAVTVLDPAATRDLYHCALATLVSDPEQLPAFRAEFAAVFGGLVDPAAQRGQTPGVGPEASGRGGGRPDARGTAPDAGGTPREVRTNVLASAGERLSGRDFAELTPHELAQLAELMRRFTLSTPPRRSRRERVAPHGSRVDLRGTLSRARRTGGHPLLLVRRARRAKPRKLVVLCDISGSMEPYARAIVRLLYSASGGARAEVFTFATRLTRLTRELSRVRPSVALERAGRIAPDWSGGTRIADSLAEFNRRYGRRGMARGAVVLIVSDGWETGDPAALGRAMAALAKVAHRIVWANPRTARADYRPLAGGMAAAWPHCDAVVSAHNLTALDDLIAALR